MSGIPLRDALPYKPAGTSGAWWNKGVFIRTFLCPCLFPVIPTLPCWLGLKIRLGMSLQVLHVQLSQAPGTGLQCGRLDTVLRQGRLAAFPRMHLTEAVEKIATS